VTHVVDLANTVDMTERGKERNVHYEITREEGDWGGSCPSIGSKLVVRVDDTDASPLDQHFDAMNEYMSKAMEDGGVVLVHCFRGKSRSATAVIQYLMQVEAMSLKDALGAVKAARPVVQLNVGFRKQLMDLEARLRPTEPPSIILKLKSAKPTLSSSNRRPHKAVAKKQPTALPTASESSDAAAAVGLPEPPASSSARGDGTEPPSPPPLSSAQPAT